MNGKLIATFIASYIILFLFGTFNIFVKWNSLLYYFGVFAIFFLSYYMFVFFQKNIKFNFADSYISIIYLIILYLGYWIGFRIYFGNYASLAHKSFAEYLTLTKTSLWQTLINSPYIYLALAAFAGWIAFYLEYYNKK